MKMNLTIIAAAAFFLISCGNRSTSVKNGSQMPGDGAEQRGGANAGDAAATPPIDPRTANKTVNGDPKAATGSTGDSSPPGNR